MIYDIIQNRSIRINTREIISPHRFQRDEIRILLCIYRRIMSYCRRYLLTLETHNTSHAIRVRVHYSHARITIIFGR